MKPSRRPLRIIARPILPPGREILFISAWRTDPEPEFRFLLQPTREGLYRSSPIPPGKHLLVVRMKEGSARVERRIEGIEPGPEPIELDLRD